LSETRFGKMVHASMGPGEENSGKLVTEIRRKAREIANQTKADFIINDGPPGIGCTAISSITGTNRILLVIEPTKSGLHDIKRLVELVHKFKIHMSAVINKSDINPAVTNEIEKYLKNSAIPLLAKIPFNETMVNAMIDGKTIIEYSPDSEISKLLKQVWDELKRPVPNKTFHIVPNE
jgi:MinD superfamily P-loop ATPase